MCEADGSRRRGLCESEFGLVEQGAQGALARCDATRVEAAARRQCLVEGGDDEAGRRDDAHRPRVQTRWQRPARAVEAFVDAHQITEVRLPLLPSPLLSPLTPHSPHSPSKPTQAIRTAMRTMGLLARAPLEPPSQTALLDASVAVAGVVGGGVPGAGGFDAVWLLACAPPACAPEERPEARVERVWATFGVGEGKVDGKGKEKGQKDAGAENGKEEKEKEEKEGEKEKEGATRVSPLLATESDAPGLRIERLEDVRGLREIVDATES